PGGGVMVPINYPVTLHAEHYLVLVEYPNPSRTAPNSGRLHRNRADAEAEADQGARRLDPRLARRVQFRITTVTPVYLPRCVVCGQFPTGHPVAYPDWWAVHEDITEDPGWLATDQHVYCPRHRPDRED
uniref:hypothetical protein n=1 Tax=Amycolatopsis sacchari TaxID=115433 RepID=UPI003D706229